MASRSRVLNYTLVDGKPRPEPDMIKWLEWCAAHDEERVLEQDFFEFRNGALSRIERATYESSADAGGVPIVVKLSTVFLGFDYGVGNEPPTLWETMTFIMRQPAGTRRYQSAASAVVGHHEMLGSIERICRERLAQLS